MSLFIETIRIENGRIHNLSYHNRRMNETRRNVLCQTDVLDLNDYIRPVNYRERTKCRVEYDVDIRNVEYAAYHFRPVSSLRLVVDDEADYRYKSRDRSVGRPERVVDRHLYLQRGILEQETMDHSLRTVTGRDEEGFVVGSGRAGCR